MLNPSFSVAMAKMSVLGVAVARPNARDFPEAQARALPIHGR
jgi:hypothetical protein